MNKSIKFEDLKPLKEEVKKVESAPVMPEKKFSFPIDFIDIESGGLRIYQTWIQFSKKIEDILTGIDNR